MKHLHKKLFASLVPAILGVALLSACGTPPPVPDDSFYRLNPRTVETGALALDGVVEIERFIASGSLANRPLLFSDKGSNAVNEYHYHFWIEAPPILLQGALVSYLRSDGVAKRVVTPEMRVQPDYTIGGRILRLETMRSSPPTGVVAFELTLRRQSDGELLVLNEYRAEITSAKNGVETDVFAIEQAVDEAFSAFVADIRTSAPQK